MENFTDDFVSYEGQDTFLKIKTAKRGLIKGESRDAQHPEEICIDWWSWGMEARSGLSGAGGSSKATLKPLHIVKRADSASTALMSTLRNNDLIKEIVLSVRKAGQNQSAYFKIFFENVRITFLEVRTLTCNGQPALMDCLSFSVQNFRVEYTPRIQEGAQGSTIIGDPGPVLLAAGLGGALKGILQGEKKASPADKTPDALGKPGTAQTAKVSTGGPLRKTVTLEEATKLFNEAKADTKIPFDYPLDCCYSRAHEMCRSFEAKGVECHKAWNYASPGKALRATTDKNAVTPDGYVDWRYHVAPVLAVKQANGSVKDMVIDPSLHNNPVPLEDWKKRMSDPDSVLQMTDSSPYYRSAGDADKVLDPDYTETKNMLKEHSRVRDKLKSDAARK